MATASTHFVYLRFLISITASRSVYNPDTPVGLSSWLGASQITQHSSYTVMYTRFRLEMEMERLLSIIAGRPVSDTTFKINPIMSPTSPTLHGSQVPYPSVLALDRRSVEGSGVGGDTD